MTTLFRPESLAARQTQWLGSVRLSQPVGYSLTASVGLAVAVGIGLFAAFGTYSKKATVPGLLAPGAGALRLTAATGGTLVDLRVGEGARVAAGDVLFVISGERVSELGETQALIARELKRRAELSGRDVLLSKARADERIRSLADRIRAIDTEISSFSRDAELHAARERIARDGLNRSEQLARTGFMSSAQTDAQRETLLGLQAQQQALNRNKAALERERLALSAQIAEVRQQQQSEASELAKAAALLAQEITENQARTRLVVTAPAHGTVTGLAVQSGQVLPAGGLLATLIPHDAATATGNKDVPASGEPLPLEAQFFATTRQAGFVEKGQRVLIRYAAYPYQKFGMGEGEVTEVSKSPYAVQELPTHVAATMQTLAQAGDPVYRVSVRLKDQRINAYGTQHALKPGMLAEADIVQDTRKLWEWALEPLFSVSGKVLASRGESRDNISSHALIESTRKGSI
ncbi:MAG: HlyD family secretion protein [Burkholderiales bacterium]|nr:HlyD family secretion protein [Burkholderiales bacterium]